MSKALGRLRRLPSDRSGGVAVLLALSLIPLTLALLGAVDLQRALSTKAQLQDALDAAALAGAREPTDDLTVIREAAGMAFRADLVSAPLQVTEGPVFALKDNNNVVAGDADATVDTLLAHLALGGRDIVVSAHSEVRRAGANLEVALVLDITASMDDPSSKIASLKQAANELVDIVVSERQTPFFSKVALVPYSAAVNLGSKADAVRGTLKSGVSDSPGWERYRFTSVGGDRREHRASTCVTERTSRAHRYDDASYEVSKAGRHYPGSVGCLNDEVLALTSNRAVLKQRIARFRPDGSTAGQIGIAWGWYMVSPNFAKLWSGEGKPKPYGTKDLVKVVVLMTDGEFNTAYANGVISRDSQDGSGPETEKINRNATNGLPKPQAEALCRNMKNAGIVVYTVGFQLVKRDAIDIMSACASSPQHAYLPGSGAELEQAFHAIGRDIARLHISR